jgi:hypothetical protein
MFVRVGAAKYRGWIGVFERIIGVGLPEGATE